MFNLGGLRRWVGQDLILHAELGEPHAVGASELIGSQDGVVNQDGEKEIGDVDVSLKGRGRGARLSVSISLLISLLSTAIGISTTFVILRADVDDLKEQVKVLTTDRPVLQERLIEMKTTLDYVRQDLVYVRGRIDEEAKKGQ